MSTSVDASKGISTLRSLDLTIGGVMFICGFSLASFVGIGSLTWPLGDDQGHYSFVGDTIMQGGVPYRDAWDLKGPLTYYLYGWIRAIFGRSELSIRVFDLAVVPLFCWQLRLLVLRLTGYSIFSANFAVLFFLLEYFGGGYWFTAQPDGWGGMLILASVWFLLNDGRNPYWDISVAAVMLGLATLLKPTFIIFLPLMLLYKRRDGIFAPANIRLFLAASIVLAGAISTAYLWVFRNGGIHDLLDAMRFAHAAYGELADRVNSERLLYGIGALHDLGLVIPYMLAPVGLWLISRDSQKSLATTLGVWFGLSIFMLIYQGVYWYYEFLPATISAAVIMGVSLKYCERLITRPIARHMLAASIFLMVGMICLAPFLSSTVFGAFGWPSYALGLNARHDYFVHIALPGDSRDESEMLSAYLSVHTSPSDKIQIWGPMIWPLALTRRTSGSRFGTTWALVAKTPMQSHYRSAFISELSRSLPRLIIVDGHSYGGDWSFSEFLRELPEFDRFLHGRYNLTGRIGEFQIWTLERSQKLPAGL